MTGVVRYPVVPLLTADGETTGEVAIDARTGATTATVAGRTFASRPKAGLRRALDTSFLELRKALRRGGYRPRTCGACRHFRYSESSRGLSAGLSGYCGLGHREMGQVGIGVAGIGSAAPPVVTLYFSCPDWAGRDERELTAFFARGGVANAE